MVLSLVENLYEEALWQYCCSFVSDVIFMEGISYSRSKRRCSVPVPARMISHKLWTVGKIHQYCLWYNKCGHLKLRLEEKAKCLDIIAVCGPPELVGYQSRESICVLVV